MANLENMKLSLALLERVRDDERPFDIRYWEAPLDAYGMAFDIGSGKVDHDCGFAACVGGWIMNDPDHNERGLFKTSYREPAMKIENDADAGIPKLSYGMDAIAHFWDVELEEAEFIACPDRYLEPSIWRSTG